MSWVVKNQVDEIVEHPGQSIGTALKVSSMLTDGKLEEELVFEPRTTIGTKFSVLHFIRPPS